MYIAIQVRLFIDDIFASLRKQVLQKAAKTCNILVSIFFFSIYKALKTKTYCVYYFKPLLMDCKIKLSLKYSLLKINCKRTNLAGGMFF